MFKRILLVSLIGLTAGYLNAGAEATIWEWEATVTDSMDGWNGLASGDAISGTLTFQSDDSILFKQPSFTVYEGPLATVMVAGVTFKQAQATGWAVSETAQSSYEMQTTASDGTVGTFVISFSGGTPQGEGLNLVAYPMAALGLQFDGPSGHKEANAVLTSLARALGAPQGGGSGATDSSPAPEPSSLALLGSGLVGFLSIRKWRK